jgi:hypothetical protein
VAVAAKVPRAAVPQRSGSGMAGSGFGLDHLRYQHNEVMSAVGGVSSGWPEILLPKGSRHFEPHGPFGHWQFAETHFRSWAESPRALSAARGLFSGEQAL